MWWVGQTSVRANSLGILTIHARLRPNQIDVLAGGACCQNRQSLSVEWRLSIQVGSKGPRNRYYK